MFFTDRKLEAWTNILGERRYHSTSSIFPMRSMENTAGPDEVNHTYPGKISGGEVNKNDFFAGRDRYLWIQKEIEIPQIPENGQLVGLFDFGDTSGGFNSGFESLLYINGKPWQGVDTWHNDVILDDFAGQTIELTFMLWTGLEGGGPHRRFYHQLKQADLGVLDTATDHLYYYAKAISQTLKLLPENSTEKTDLISALNRALLLIDWEEDFYNTVPDALASLEESLGQMEKHSDVTVHCVGHTHIDVAWLWRLKHTREKAMRSFSTAVRLMEEFDSFVFIQSQPQLYDYVKHDCPELFERIRQKVAEGQWEPDGAMWLEADCNIPCGESLVRQIVYGTHFFKEEFGRDCNSLWLPDVFGYSWALPQILKGCGIKTFVTTKISWNQYNHLPHDLFWWRGIDGSEILTYFITTPVENEAPENFFTTYNGFITAETVKGSWDRFQDKAVSRDTLISYGHGDGGGGVTRDMIKTGMALEKIPGIPHVKFDSAGNFFEKIHEDVENTDSYVHTWDGELYLEYHRGTYTSQSRNKRSNRLTEMRLLSTEWLSCLNILLGGTYPEEELHNAWEVVLRNQFHDIIPGSSIHEVYQDSTKEYAMANENLDRAGASLRLTDGEKNAVTVFNPSSFERNESILLPDCGGYMDDEKNILTSVRTKEGIRVQIHLDPLEVRTLYRTPAPVSAPASVFKVEEENTYIETPFYRITLDKAGWLDSVYDLAAEREVLDGYANRLELYDDRPINYDAWDIDIYYKEKMDIALADGKPEIIENNAERLVLRTIYRYNRSVIQQDMILYAAKRRIDFETKVDWHESHKLLKTVFPMNIRTTKATYDIQYGHVERPTHWNTSWDLAKFEVCGHKWGDLSEADYGAAVLNNCKYGYSAKDNVITLSLLKSAKYPDTEADMGEHSFTYSLLPHNGPAACAEVISEASALNLPVVVLPGRSPLSGKVIFRADTDHVQIDAVKRAEDGDGMILRLHECRGGSTSVNITSDFPISRWQRCNLLEQPEGCTYTDSAISLKTGPFGLHTFRVWF